MITRIYRKGLASRLLLSLTISAWAGAALAQSAASPLADTRLSGSGSVQAAKPHLYADVLVEGDSVSGTYTFIPKAADVGKSARVYVVARVQSESRDSWFTLQDGNWSAWSGRLADLPAVEAKLLAATETVTILQDQPLFAGSYQIFAGYQVPGEALMYSRTPFSFDVQSEGSDTLQRFASAEAMAAFIKDGMQSTSTVEYYRGSPRMLAADSSLAGASRTSSTNLQESGVDEADTVKVSGDKLFMLQNCDLASCLEVHRLDSSSAGAELLASYKLEGSQAPDSMYLVDTGPLGQKTLVTLAGQNLFRGWFSIWGWQDGKTELEFLNIADPANITRTEKLTIDGALVASRRVGDMLYLVTRYTPAIEGYEPFPVERAQEDENKEILERTALPDILPRVEDSRERVLDLVQSKDCYLPVSAADGSPDPSIITITSIPLFAPAGFKSTCFLGGSETLYMSTDSLYLATTSWDYGMLAADALVYSPNHTTAIHKFALDNGNIDYRGSGEVQGHLGWDEDKKSFRMGENGAYLNVVTSVGDSWDGSASTMLTVLKEGAAGALQTVNTIKGIGKPGEQLYAARFLGDRAYLVTFRVIDPLYVVDLSNQENPRIAGELEIAGYSDYLHPVSANLLLGIGKDAVADTRATDEGGGRGAWYQGVKVALFDVSDPARPVEINSLVLGKRGTESDVSWDHHAFSYLPAADGEPARFSMPVQLHDRTPRWEGFDPASPDAWYDYTHTGLYSFEVSALGVSQVGSLIAQVYREGDDGGLPIDIMPLAREAAASTMLVDDRFFAPYFRSYGDRAVLKDDAVYYLHEGKLHSSFWGESKAP